MLTNCLKGLAAIAIMAASPVFIVFAAPFGCGIADDLLDAAGTPAAIAVTAAASLAALSWARYRQTRPGCNDPGRIVIGATPPPI